MDMNEWFTILKIAATVVGLLATFLGIYKGIVLYRAKIDAVDGRVSKLEEDTGKTFEKSAETMNEIFKELKQDRRDHDAAIAKVHDRIEAREDLMRQEFRDYSSKVGALHEQLAGLAVKHLDRGGG